VTLNIKIWKFSKVEEVEGKKFDFFYIKKINKYHKMEKKNLSSRWQYLIVGSTFLS